MGKLHELLAVEASLRGQFQKIIQEAKKVFKDKHLFSGGIKRLDMFKEDQNHLSGEVERVKLETTVSDKLEYIRSSISAHLDCVLQKDSANSEAKADLEVAGFGTLMTNVPATYFLTLEKELKQIREVFESLPTLDKGVKWELSTDGVNIYETSHPKTTEKTEKFRDSRIIAPATKEHKAQVEVWAADRVVGKYTTEIQSGAITSGKKSEVLRRLDILINSVKESRARANCVEVPKIKIGSEIFDYLIGDLKI